MTRFSGSRPSRASIIACAFKFIIASLVLMLALPICGRTVTFGSVRSGLFSETGSVSNTSSPAAPNCIVFQCNVKVSLINNSTTSNVYENASIFHKASYRAPIIPAVSGVNGAKDQQRNPPLLAVHPTP